ncbi:hypothetical protein BpHYR1_019833 [Brachionus plicatilis]|uniref:Uncharacterized protein n=1 Tax=Brachionus plicatilis TaxID=10195 RepID=A0A3M7QR22_BRAPC|nr:hypothetical protein BpHYR1_019833 [Brachionus plicatilis]
MNFFLELILIEPKCPAENDNKRYHSMADLTDCTVRGLPQNLHKFNKNPKKEKFGINVFFSKTKIKNKKMLLLRYFDRSDLFKYFLVTDIFLTN